MSSDVVPPESTTYMGRNMGNPTKDYGLLTGRHIHSRRNLATARFGLVYGLAHTRESRAAKLESQAPHRNTVPDGLPSRIARLKLVFQV